MFDAVLAPPRNPRRSLLIGGTTALVVQGGFIALAIAMGGADEGKVEEEDVTFVSFRAPPPPPPPPAPPPRPRARRAVKPRPPPEVPVITRDTSSPAPVAEPAPTDEPPEDPVEGGVEGGVLGGIIGGSVGGALGALGGEAVPLTEDMEPPQLLSGEEPKYTKEALDARAGGLLIARCMITRQGSVERCAVIKSVPGMNDAVLESLSTRRYRPAQHMGRAIAVEYLVRVRLVPPSR